MTPIAENNFLKEIGFSSESQQTNLSNVSWWCDLLHRAVGSKGSDVTSKETIEELLRGAAEKRRRRIDKQADANKPPETDANEPAGADTKAK